LRVRTRLSLNWESTDSLSFGLRLRSGSDVSQQSPHITVLDFDDNDTGPADFNLDKWYARIEHEELWGWAGRNSFPFWKQNDLFWDDDVMPAGVAGGWEGSAGDDGTIAINIGYLSLPVGMKEFSGELAGAQVVYTRDGETADLTLAAGLFDFDGNLSDPDAATLRKGNGLRDYSIWVLNGQMKLAAGGRPLTLGIDSMHNGTSYSAEDAFGYTNRGETDGFVVSAKWGSTSTKGDWLVGYWYGEIGALAVNASFAGDDWIRWGSSAQTDASNLEGHELRFAYGLGRPGNLVLRLFLVDAITSQQDGKRLRLDYNVKF